MIKKNDSKISVVYKVWLENKGKAFGEGPYQLLKGIDRTGSLSQAAADMGMSYRKAWGVLQVCEKRLGFHLIERQAGGASGGYSKITVQCGELMKQYGKFIKEVGKSIETIYKRNMNLFIQDQHKKHLCK